MNSKTKSYDLKKHKAVELRREGKTFSEIIDEVGHIPKSTMSGWLKSVELTDLQKNRIKKQRTINGSIGRQIGAWKNQQKRKDRIAQITNSAQKEYKINLENESFLVGLVLYLAEGAKKSERFMFMNSDPKLIKVMLDWVLKFSDNRLEEVRFRLYIHENYKSENCEVFWKEQLGVKDDQFLKTIYKPTGRKYKKNPRYKGCLRMEVSGSKLYWKTMAWRDCFYSTIR